MKKLQVIKGDDLRPWTNFAQVKDGKVWITEGTLVLMLPVREVLGNEVEGEWYIDRKLFGLLKFPSATFIGWNPETGVIRNIKAGTELRLLGKEEFEKTYSRFPDVPPVVHPPEKELTSVDRIGFDANLLKNLVDCWGISPEKIRYNFYGADRGIILDTDKSKSEGFAMLMPVNIKIENSSFYPEPEPEKGQLADPEPEKETADVSDLL